MIKMDISPRAGRVGVLALSCFPSENGGLLSTSASAKKKRARRSVVKLPFQSTPRKQTIEFNWKEATFQTLGMIEE